MPADCAGAAGSNGRLRQHVSVDDRLPSNRQRGRRAGSGEAERVQLLLRRIARVEQGVDGHRVQPVDLRSGSSPSSFITAVAT